VGAAARGARVELSLHVASSIRATLANVDVRRVRRKLLSWYRSRRRDLPWRRTDDPYRIWISEVMLQQTRVEAARGHYERFVARFPTLGDLARAPLDDVLASWSGLGYYQRARSLHAAVRECVERYDGRVPDDPVAFRTLSGVGPYTAAAVQSIAYSAPLAAVDGNVVRVVARLGALDGHARSPRLRAAVDRIAAELLSPRQPGDHNQAMMELGATVCTPRAPRCHGCPLVSDCRAAALERPLAYPAPAPRPRPRDVLWEAAVVVRRGRLLLVRRPDQGRLRGMWELPWAEASFAAIGPRYGIRLDVGEEIVRVRHGVLAERISLVARTGRLRGRAAGERFTWIEPARLGELPLASVWHKVVDGAKDLPSSPFGAQRGAS